MIAGWGCIQVEETAPEISPGRLRFFISCHQIITLWEGARYILSVFFTLKVAYHSGKFLGGILARR
jgi:hypothetical protein